MSSPRNHLRAEQSGTNPIRARRAVPMRLPDLIGHEKGSGVYRSIVTLAGCGRLYTATVDRPRQHIGLAMRLGALSSARLEQLAAMDRIQERCNMCRLDRDVESGFVWLRAGSVLTDGGDANLLLSALFADAGIILSDDRLSLVVNG